MTSATSFDSIWEEKIYSQGRQLNRYPYDVVVSFVYSQMPRHKARNEIKILEVGCGAGNNLWFAAREGFQVTGIDASVSAIAYARQRFAKEGLSGDLRVGDFTELPFDGASFDLVIDRAAITCCGFSTAKKVVKEINRVLVTRGKFFFNPYSKKHGSYLSGNLGPDGVILDISIGTLLGVGQICFYGELDLEQLFNLGWKLHSKQHLKLLETVASPPALHAEWRVVAEKTG